MSKLILLLLLVVVKGDVLKISSERLKALRHRLMLTQSELGERAGISLYTVHAAEHGRNVAPKTGRALAKALGVEPEELLEELEAPKVDTLPPSEGDARWRAISPDFRALVESLESPELHTLRDWLENERIRLGLAHHDSGDDPFVTSEFGRAIERFVYVNAALAARAEIRATQKAKEVSDSSKA